MGERLGQHFLKNKHFLRRIAAALELTHGDTVIEIGAGHGELTKEIIARLQDCKIAGMQNCLAMRDPAKKDKIEKFFAIERDGELFEELVNNPEFKNKVKFVHGDVLKVLPEIISNLQFAICNYKLVGNIPYYLTGRLLRVVSELAAPQQRGEPRPNEPLGREPKLLCAAFTIQQEVAERLCVQPPKMNLLAAAVQVWATPEIVGHIPRKEFSPAPKVDSAIIKLVPIPNYPLTQLPNYYRFLKILFQQPRKTILNNLRLKGDSTAALAEKLQALGIDPVWRPQNLSVNAILKLSEMWYTKDRRQL